MLFRSIVLYIVALLAAFIGFTNTEAGIATFAQVLFFIFATFFVLSLVEDARRRV